ncbi:M73 family metallopeptidase [Cellulomonas sp. DKR-3]|uniref:M73 family metallopeptidase n=1 Tax=Cellulomonas fulva TaxID=2835530 RepID=A0ABS5TYF8_9CELL|nr:M73 family metallopeptidase [Cellulomonas fulva]MBT0994122.1 M73 family metallopeptidase [Cellulomonas fulva]
MDDLLQEMVNPAPAQGEKARRRRVWATITVVGLAALGITSLTTSAFFTDEDTTNDAITTGTIDIASTELDFGVPVDNMLPGASVVSPITVSNEGSLRYQYALEYNGADGAGTGSGNLTDQLRVRVYALAAAQCTLPNTNVAVTENRLDSVGDAWGLPAADTDLIGEVGVDEATDNRFLSAGASEELCVRVDFSSAAGNEYQDTSATVNLGFWARQLTFQANQPGESNN